MTCMAKTGRKPGSNYLPVGIRGLGKTELAAYFLNLMTMIVGRTSEVLKILVIFSTNFMVIAFHVGRLEQLKKDIIMLLGNRARLK
ncbi:MAG: hypothetical protein ACI8ZB_002712 [Desulforhopalus sp.]|jgi:hypothetical protein